MFQDWREDPTSPDFERVNVIYGINGSGKSSISSMLAEAHSDSTWTSGLKLKVIDASGNPATIDGPGAPFWRNIYVFNKDYVTQNLRFDVDGESTTKPLLVLGKKRIDQQSRTIEIEDRIRQIDIETDRANKDKQKAERQSAKLATDTATIISQELAGAGARYAPRSYDARKVKQLLDQAAGAVSSDIPADLTIVNAPEHRKIQELGRSQFDTAQLQTAVSQLLEKTATSQSLVDLRDDAQRAEWVQGGMSLHAAGDDCAFCGNEVTADRLAVLGQHFDESLRKLQIECNDLISQIDRAGATLTHDLELLPAQADLDASLHDDWKDARARLSKDQVAVSDRLADLKSLAESKTAHLFTAVKMPKELDGSSTLDLSSIADLIAKHNKIAGDSTKRKQDAALRVEWARVEVIRPEYEAAVEKVSSCGKMLAALVNERRELEKESRELAQADLDATPLADRLNEDLARLLGRNELSFELANEGYVIRRGNEPALYLSEGEKTAISLLYFLKSEAPQV